jgi:hypothetical protein
MSAPPPASPSEDPGPAAKTNRAFRPGMARARLPFESDDALRRQRSGKGWAVLYAIGAIALAAMAGYHWIQTQSLADVRVWAPGLVGLWFVVRAVMVHSAGRDDDEG